MDRSSFISLMLSAGLISSAAPVMSYSNSFDTASGDFHAFLIGVTEYGQQKLNTDQDCKVLSSVLKKAGYKSIAIQTGYSDVDSLRIRLKTFSEKASENDTLLFFFAGHGTRVGDNDVLSIHNGRSTENLLVNDVVDLLRGSMAANIIFVFDCCRKGVVRSEGERFIPRLAGISDGSKKNILLIQSCKADEVSFEETGSEDEASGLFTRGLVNFISTTRKSDNVDGLGVKTYFASGINAGSKTQNPTVEGELSIVLCKGLGVTVAPPPKPKQTVELTITKNPSNATVTINKTPVTKLMRFELEEDENERYCHILATAIGFEDYEDFQYFGPGKHTVDVEMRSLLEGTWKGTIRNFYGVNFFTLIVDKNLNCDFAAIYPNRAEERSSFQFRQTGLSAKGEEMALSVGTVTFNGTLLSTGKKFRSTFIQNGSPFSVTFTKDE
jgi:hypothetical protein